MTTSDDGTYMGFIGVSTKSSSIMKIFPRWADMLGLPTRKLIGHDIELGAPAEVFRDVVSAIRKDPNHRGALVTTHKMSVYELAGDLFDQLDDLAQTFGEISSIAKRKSHLTGGAKDPLTVRLALEEFLPHDHFTTTRAEALVLGSGGSGCALSHQLGVRADRPTRIVCTARSRARLRHSRELHERAGIEPGLMQYEVTPSSEHVDNILKGLAPGSLVVNATGMGKDRPGSPLSAAGKFPKNGVVWEFNYRGSLDFLHQARAQQLDRELLVEDGWRYFIHGWSQVIADVFDITMPQETVDALARVAAEER
jgi:shikimate dehydrogenase